jgi:ribosome maturation factor RimP
MAAIDRVRPFVLPVLADLGLDLYDLEHAGGVLKVTVDKDGGVDLESIALATRLISRELDQHDPFPGRYTLEVTSPGLERPLRTPDHFQRVIGWTINVRTHAHVEGDRRVQGMLKAADHHGIKVILAEPRALTERALAYADIERAKTVFEWAATDKPVGPKPKAAIATRRTGRSADAADPAVSAADPAVIAPDAVVDGAALSSSVPPNRKAQP